MPSAAWVPVHPRTRLEFPGCSLILNSIRPNRRMRTRRSGGVAGRAGDSLCRFWCLMSLHWNALTGKVILPEGIPVAGRDVQAGKSFDWLSSKWRLLRLLIFRPAQCLTRQNRID